MGSCHCLVKQKINWDWESEADAEVETGGESERACIVCDEDAAKCVPYKSQCQRFDEHRNAVCCESVCRFSTKLVIIRAVLVHLCEIISSRVSPHRVPSHSTYIAASRCDAQHQSQQIFQNHLEDIFSSSK